MSKQRQNEPDLSAEAAVIGACISGLGRVRSEIVAILKPNDFLHGPHALAFASILALEQSGCPVDLLTLSEHMKSTNTLQPAGGPGFIFSLDTQTPNAANGLEYARIVAEASAHRRINAIGRRLADRSARADGTPIELAAEAESAILDAVSSQLTGNLVPVPVVLDKTLDLLDKMRQPGFVNGVATGFHDLDRHIRGMRPGNLLIVAARPGVGKTAFALGVAHHAAASPMLTALFSLEMPSEELTLRLLASEARVSLSRLLDGGLSDPDFHKINNAAGRIANADLHIDDTAALSLLAMRSRCKNLERRSKKKLGLVVVDYLQLMGSERGRSREEEVASNSRGLKQLAKDLGCPVIALSQLNRKVEDRKGGRPQLSDLRESGSIEQDADVVMFLHHDAEDDAAQPNTLPIDLIVAKQRNGPTGTIPMIMLSEYTRFESRTSREDFRQ